MTAATSYPVDTLEQMARIPAEARGRFLAELPAILDHAAALVGLKDALGEVANVDLSGAEWVDDDKNLRTINTIVSDETGQVVESQTRMLLVREGR